MRGSHKPSGRGTCGYDCTFGTDPQKIAHFRQASRKLAETSLDREKLAAKAVVWLESLAELEPVNPLE